MILAPGACYMSPAKRLWSSANAPQFEKHISTYYWRESGLFQSQQLICLHLQILCSGVWIRICAVREPDLLQSYQRQYESGLCSWCAPLVLQMHCLGLFRASHTKCRCRLAYAQSGWIVSDISNTNLRTCHKAIMATLPEESTCCIFASVARQHKGCAAKWRRRLQLLWACALITTGHV